MERYGLGGTTHCNWYKCNTKSRTHGRSNPKSLASWMLEPFQPCSILESGPTSNKVEQTANPSKWLIDSDSRKYF